MEARCKIEKKFISESCMYNTKPTCHAHFTAFCNNRTEHFPCSSALLSKQMQLFHSRLASIRILPDYIRIIVCAIYYSKTHIGSNMKTRVRPFSIQFHEGRWCQYRKWFGWRLEKIGYWLMDLCEKIKLLKYELLLL